MSLAQRWKERVKSGQAGAPATVGNAGPGGKGSVNKSQLMQLLDTGLDVALKALKGLKSKSDKVAYKKDKLLPEFVEYVNRLMDKGWEHPLLPWFMVWCLDVGLMEKALTIAKFCMEKGIKLDGEAFARDIPTLVADLTHKWAEQSFKDGHSPEPYFSDVFDLVAASTGTDPWAQHDEVRAKFFKLKGLIEYDAGDLAAAQEHLQKAYDLGATVKTVLAEVIKKAEASQSAEANGPEGGEK